MPGRLAIAPRPRGGDWLEDDVRELRRLGLDILVSMLEPTEAAELGLSGEGSVCARTGLDFVSIPIQDRGVPESGLRFAAAVAELHARVAAGAAIGVHCRACIGRSSLIAAAVLVASGLSPSEAWRRLESARGVPVPDTEEQRNWLECFGALRR